MTYATLAAAIGPQTVSMCSSSSDRLPEPAAPRGPLRDLPEWLLPQAAPSAECPLGAASKIGAYPAAHRPSIAASRSHIIRNCSQTFVWHNCIYCWFLFLFSSSIVVIEHLLTVYVFSIKYALLLFMCSVWMFEKLHWKTPYKTMFSTACGYH
jgi:hypothetical protein